VSSANRTVQIGRLEQLIVRFIYWVRADRPGRRFYPLLRFVNVEIRPTVRIGPGLLLLHLGSGHRVFRYATLGANVVLGPNVLVGGKSDLWGSTSSEDTELTVEDDVIFGTGSVLLCRAGSSVRIGRGTVLGANAVLRHSTGPWEIWAGNPARLVGHRQPPLDEIAGRETSGVRPAAGSGPQVVPDDIGAEVFGIG
jgi:serine O-acetyltransferase